MKHTALALAAWALALGTVTGCNTLAPVIDAGAKINDEAVQGAETTICRAASVGAIVRSYGQNPEKLKAWCGLCGDSAGIVCNPRAEARK